MSRPSRNRPTRRISTKPDAAETAPPANRSPEAAAQVESLVAVEYRGPLPPPAVLVKYNEAFPGCAERIVAMAERQATHRQALESRALAGKLTAERRGQALGFAVALTAVIAGGTLIAFDKDAGGLATIAGALGGLVAVFVYGRRKDAEERRQKRADFASSQPAESTTNGRDGR